MVGGMRERGRGWARGKVRLEVQRIGKELQSISVWVERFCLKIPESVRPEHRKAQIFPSSARFLGALFDPRPRVAC